MPSTKKLPSGSWRCRACIGKDENGKYKYKSFTALTKKDAEFLAADYLTAHPVVFDCRKITLKQAMQSYIESKSAVLSPSTIRGYKSILKSNLQSIMETDINNLTQQSIQSAINEEAKSHAPKTVRNICGLMTAVISMFRPQFHISITLPQKKKAEIFIPSDDEIKRLCETAKKYNCLLPVYLAAFCGLRRSEIAALNLDNDVDFETGNIRIDEAIVMNENREWVSKTTKSTNSTRTVPAPEFVIKALEECKNAGNKIMDCNPDATYSRFEHAAKALHLNHHIRFHDLRHYYASTLLEMGIPDKYAMQLMGHSSDRMLKLVYQHTKAEKEQEVRKKVKSAFSQIMTRL